jgi:hypothetical protein
MPGVTPSSRPRIAQIASSKSLAAFIGGGIAVFATSLFAQLPSPQLTSVFPLGAKQGATVDITLGGTDLDDADKLLFSHPGIKATPKMSEATEFVKGPRPLGTSFQVQVAADVPPGTYDVRAVGRFGVSNPRLFVVGDQEEVPEAAGNNSLEKAQELPLGAVVNARADANARDFYKFTLNAGQRVLVECWAEQLDSKLDATLVLYGPDGREVARQRNASFGDTVIDFTAPAAGQYAVAVYDFVFGGGADYFYRLSVHGRPRIDFVFPPSGPPGSNNSYTVYGRNLPGGQPAEGVTIGKAPLQKLTTQIAIPADEMALASTSGLSLPRSSLIEHIEFRLPGSNSVAVGVSRAAQVVEQEPNNAPAQAQKITVPCEYVGQFYPQRDADWIQFDAKKGDVFLMDVLSHRLGLESDPLLLVKKVGKNDKGEEVMTDVASVDDPGDRNARIGGDFDTSTDDPSYKFTAAEDATYRVQVRDQFGDARLDASTVYRLVIRKGEPDFRAIVVAMPPPAGAPNQPAVPLGVPTVRRGGTVTVQLNVERRDDFKGEVAVSVEGLPAGVTCPGAVLGGDASTTQLVFTATEDAAAWAGPIRVIAKAQVEGKEVVRIARAGSIAWGTANRQTTPPAFRITREFVIAVTDKEVAPAFVKVGEDQVWETSLGGKLEVPVSLVRRGDYKEAVKLTAVGLPAEIKPAEINLDPNTAAGKLEIPVTNQATKPGVYTFVLRTDTKMKYARNPDAVKAAEEDQAIVVQRVAERDKAAKEATAAKDAATKAAQEAAAAVKTAEQAKTTAANAAKQAADAAKQAADKLNAAKEAAAKNAADQNLQQAVAAAQKAADDATAAAKTTSEAAAAADKAFTEAQTKAKAADEAKVKAEATAKEATDKLTQANQKKTEADKRVTDLKNANQPKDVNLPIFSTPVKLRVVASPMKLAPAAPQIVVKQGEKAELAFKLERLYGFADAAEVTLELPAGVKGLAAPKLTVANGQADGKFEVTADKAASEGEHTVTLRVKAKFNNVNVETTGTVVVKVDKAS